MEKLMIFATLALMISCSSDPYKLTKAALDVEVLGNKPRNQECVMLGKVSGSNEQGSVELARNQVRNRAAELKADSVFITEEIPNGSEVKVYADVYKCN